MKAITDAIEAARFAKRSPPPGGTVIEEDGLAVFLNADGSLSGFMNLEDYKALRGEVAAK